MPDKPFKVRHVTISPHDALTDTQYDALLEKGWVYRDKPWTPIDIWNELLTVAGEGNYEVLIHSDKTIEHEGKPLELRRGQLFLSPTAIANLKAFGEKLKAEGK